MKTKLTKLFTLLAALGLASAASAATAVGDTVTFNNTTKGYSGSAATFANTETWKITIPSSPALPPGTKVRLTTVAFGMNSSGDTLAAKKINITVDDETISSGLANGTGNIQTSTKLGDNSLKQSYAFGAEGDDNECVLTVGKAYVFAFVDADGAAVAQRMYCKQTADALYSPIKQDTTVTPHRISQVVECVVTELPSDFYFTTVDCDKWYSDLKFTKGGSSASYDNSSAVQMTLTGNYWIEASANKNFGDIYLTGTGDDAALTVNRNYTFKNAYIGIPTTAKANSVKFSGISLSDGGSLTFDASAGSYTIDDSNTKTAIRSTKDKVTFKGSGSNGVTLNYGTEMSAGLSSHLIFDGGTHAFTYGMGSADVAFSTTGTLDNPTLLVKNGTTLNYTLKDQNGWNGSRKDGTFVRAASGSTLNILPSGNSSMFMSGRMVLEPGSTTTYKTGTDSNGFCIYGGVDTAKPQLYVPSPASGAANTVATLNKHADSSKNIKFGKSSGTGGAAITVDSGATLHVNSPVEGDQTVTKGGEGTLKISGDTSGYSGGLCIAAGTVEVTGRDDFNFSIPDRKLQGTLRIASGATYKAKTGDSPDYTNNKGNVEVYGTLNMDTKRWTFFSNNKLYVYAGGLVSGTGDTNGALDFNQQNTIYAKDSDSANKTATISAVSKLQNPLTVTVDSGVTLDISGTMKYTSNKAYTKDGAGTLILSGTQDGGSDDTWTVSAGTLRLPNTVSFSKITVSSGATLEPARGISLPALDGSGTVYVTLTDEEVAGQSTALSLFTCTSKTDTLSIFVTDSQGRQYTATASDTAYVVDTTSPKGLVKINETETEYPSLAEAFAAVEAGQTVTLLADFGGPATATKSFTLALNGKTFSGAITVANGGNMTISGATTSTLTGTIAPAEGGIVTVSENIDNARHRLMLAKTTGNGTLRMTVSGNTELQIHSDTTPLTANVNVEYLGTDEIHFVGTDEAGVDQYTVSTGKTVKFENGTIWAKRSVFYVYGTLIAKYIKLGHESGGAYTGKVTVYDDAVVKTEKVTFANKGGSSGLDIQTGGVFEFLQNDSSAIALAAFDKTYSVSMNGGTLKASDSSWYIDSGITVTAVDGTTTTLYAAEDKTLELKSTISGNGGFVADGAGTVILPAAYTGAITVNEGTTLKIRMTTQQQLIDGYDGSNITLEDGGTVIFVRPDGTEVAGVEDGKTFRAEIPSGLLRYGFAFNSNLNKMSDASETLSISGSHTYVDGVNDKALQFTSGQNYGTGFSFGSGDFTIVAVVKAPTDDNKCIFGLGGQSGTTGMLGMGRTTGNNIRFFTKGNTELKTVEVANATTEYHIYAIRYNSTTKKLSLSVDFGEFGDEVDFTANTSSAQFQFGGVHGGCPSGFGNASNGAIDEFRLHTAYLSAGSVKQAAASFYPSYEATIPADATGTLKMSELAWYPSVSTLYANKSWKIVNNASADVTTVEVDGSGTVAVNTLTVVSAEKVLKFAGFANLSVTTYDFSNAPGGVGIGVTGGWTVPEATRNYFRDNETKIVFYGAGDKGATLTYSNSGSGTFKSHFVFDGGTHSMTYCGALNNATAGNPSILVKDGTTLDFYGHDMGGYTGSANIDGIIAVADGGRINLHNTNGTFYYHQRFTLNPGSDMYLTGDAQQIRFQGGCVEGEELLYVPDSTTAGDPAVIHATDASKDTIGLWNDSTIGFGIYVGNNSALEIENAIKTQNGANTYEIKKWGAGKLTLNGSLAGFTGTGNGKGKLSMMAGDLVLGCGGTIPMTLWASSSTTVEIAGDADTTFSGPISGVGGLKKTGAGIATLSGANDYSGTTTVEAGTLKVAESASLGTGNYSVAEGATLDLGTVRPSGLLVGTSKGTVNITISDADKATLDDGGTVETLTISGDSFAGSLKVFDTAGAAYEIDDLTYNEGKIVITKKEGAKTSPFNLTAAKNLDVYGGWTTLAWKDSSTGQQAVEAADWDVKVAANIAITSEDVDEGQIYFDKNLALSSLNITNAGEIAIVDIGYGSLTVDAIDDSASTGKTELGFNIGAASVTAGANTVLDYAGTGALTVGAGKKATLNKGVTMGSIASNAGTIRYEEEFAADQTIGTLMPVNGVYEFKKATISGGGSTAKTIQVQTGDEVTLKSGNDDLRANTSLKVAGGKVYLGAANNGAIWYGVSNTSFEMTDGEVVARATGTGQSGSGDGLLIGWSGAPSTFNISGGTLNVTNSSINFWSATTTVNLSGTGVVKAKGVFAGQSAGIVNLNGGTFEIGSLGWKAGAATLKLNGGTLKALEDGAYVKNAITLDADSTLNVPSGMTMKIYGALTTGDYKVNVTGGGTLIFMDGSDITPNDKDSKYTVADGTSVCFGKTVGVNNCGEYTPESPYTTSNVKLFYANGDAVENRAVSGNKITFDWKITGSACWWDYEFNGSLANTGTDTTQIGQELTDPYYNAASNALRVGYATPWCNVSAYPQEFTALFYGKMVDHTNHVEMAFGSTTGGTTVNVAIACGDPVNEEVKIIISTAFTTGKTVTMSVPNAYSADHLYAFVAKTIDDGGTEKTKVIVYLDGVEWDSYTFDSKVTLGTGFQIGSVHGAVPSGCVKADTSNQNADLDWLRVYNVVLTQDTMTKYADKYPYTSKNGTSEREFTGNSSWDVGEDSKPWSVTLFDKTTYVTNVALAGSVVKVEADTAASEVTINLTEATQYEAMRLAGDYAITLKAGDNAIAPSVVGLTTIATDVTNAYNAVNFGKVEVQEGNKLVYDFTTFPFNTYFASATIEFTGAVSGEGTVEAIGLPTTGARTAQFVKNASNHYELQITVDADTPFIFTIAAEAETGTWTFGGAEVTENVVKQYTTIPIWKKGDGSMTNVVINRTYVVKEGTMVAGDAANKTGTVMVEAGATFDFNGKKDGYTTINLNGGSLVNNGVEMGTGSRQIEGVTLSANSTIGGTGNFGMSSSGHHANTLDLGGKTLTKADNNIFFLINTTVTNGAVNVTGGTLQIVESATTFTEATLTIGEDATLDIDSTLNIDAITGNGGTIDNAGTLGGFTLNGTATLTGNGTWGTITNAVGAVANVGTKRDFTFAGAGSVKAQLTEAYKPGDTVAIFKVADSATTGIAELKDASGKVIDSSYYTFSNGTVTFKKEAAKGTLYYFTLKQAIEEQTGAATIELVADVTDAEKITVAHAITFEGGTNILENATFTFDGGTITFNSGCIGIAYASGMNSASGICRFNSTVQESWTGHGPTDYSMATLSTPVRTGTTYQYEFVKSGFAPASDEVLMPVANADGTDAGAIKLNSKWVVTATGGEIDPQKQAVALNTKQTNNLMTWENAVLGLDGDDEESKPVVAPVQTATADAITFKLGGCAVDTDSGATVTYKVYGSTDKSTWSAVSEETAHNETASVTLPESGVKYYKFEVITATSK